MQLKIDDLRSKEIKELLTTHLDNSAKLSPPECVFALNLDELRVPEITFWTAWEDSTGNEKDLEKNSKLLGCGALKEISPKHGEIKSMHTYESSRGKGVASLIVKHIISVAKQRNYHRLSLETGTETVYAQAHALYQKFGFTQCPAFADYPESEHSVFLTLAIE